MHSNAMTWFGWALAAWFAFSILVTVLTVGRPRKPTDPGTAAVILVVDAALILGVLLIGAGHF